MQAIILAGGKGTRLRPYTSVLPKPLMPVGELPILEIVLRQLKADGVTHTTLTVGHLASLIESYFGHGEKLGMDISYSREDQPLGTAGPLGLIDRPKDDFLVMNGDLLTTFPFGEFAERHRQSGAICTVGVYRKTVKMSLGVLDLDGDQIVGYREKPELVFPVSMGIYMFSPEVLKHIPRNKYLDLPDLILKLIAEKEDVGTYIFDGIWLDIGRKTDYEEASEVFEEHKNAFLRIP